MHITFIPYGNRMWVENLFRDMEAQKFYLTLTKENKKKVMLIPGAIRQLPFGLYDYIFPKEYYDVVIATLGGGESYGQYKHLKKIFSLIRKTLKLKKFPKYNDKEKFPWSRENVSIITLGLREDGELIDEHGESKGWKHEAL